MDRDLFDLGGLPWRFGRAPRQPFVAEPLDDRATVAEWLPARVPGDVRADLLATGQIASLDTPEGIAASGWVDEADWWYRTEIQALWPDAAAVLEADGVDYLSAVYLDGCRLATHAGMFARQSIVLPSRLLTEGRHELAIRVWGAGAIPRLVDSRARRALRGIISALGVGAEYFPDRMAAPKAQFSFGWDFSPRVLSTGIWDDLRLVRCRGAYLAGVYAVPAPLSDRDDPVPVRWNVRLQVIRFSNAPLHVVVALNDEHGEPVRLSQTKFALGDREEVGFAFDASALARWWPWDQGEPRLYRLTVKLFDDLGKADETETIVGVRTVRRDKLPNGAPWCFIINGRPVFLRGANWVPADILPGRVTGKDYQRLIGLARSAGINFLRIWGGGIREKAAFWDVCNRLGMMATQEFPLACAFLDHYPRDPQHLSVLETEAQGIVTGLRNHPSLIAWCGGNEISPRRERLPLRTIERVLEREEGTRPWIPASPAEGDVHQWDVWHGGAPWQSLSKTRAPFMSEFGLQALPAEETIREMFPLGLPASLDDRQWQERKLQALKLRHYAGPLPEADLVATIEATQRAQAAALQAGIEGCRLRREGSGDPHPCGGVAFWQWNEPWPVVSWSVIDRKGRSKLAFDTLLRGYQPLLVAARFERRAWAAGEQFRAEIWLVNDSPQPMNGCAVEATFDGGPIHPFGEAAVGPGSAIRVAWLNVQLCARPEHLELNCWHEGVVVAQNRYDLAVYLPPPQPLGAWLLRRATAVLLR